MLFLLVLSCALFSEIFSESTLSYRMIEDSSLLDCKGYDNCNMATNGELSVVCTAIKSGAVIFDIGANVGDWSDTVLKYHPQVKIYAFEPIPHLASNLKMKFSRNPVSVYPYAISCENGEREFSYYGECSAVSSLYERPALASMKAEKINIFTITLDDFCQEHGIKRIDFMKIDTEGNEFNVLLGADHLLTQKVIGAIQFEYGGTYPDAGITLQQVYNYLRTKGYRVYRITSECLIHINAWRDALENNLYSNYLAILE